MAPKTPAYRVTWGSEDITLKLNPRLLDLSLTECRGDKADQVDITLSDHDGLLAMPPKGAALEVYIGWDGEALVHKGSFMVDEVEHFGAPDRITVRARSAELSKTIRKRKEHSYHATTIGAILKIIAARNGLVLRVDDRLSGRAIAHIDQTNESDVAFVTRLAKLYDAVATVKHGHLLFLPILGTKTSKGKSIPSIALTRADGDNHRYHTNSREKYSGVRAYWHDPNRARRRGVLVGQSGNAKRMKQSFATEADARAAAVAEWRRLQRGATTFELTLAQGVPELAPQTPVKVSGWKPEIDGTSWLTLKVTHTIGDGGFTTAIELENGEADEAEGGTVSDDEGDQE
jgi:hypothetical protein